MRQAGPGRASRGRYVNRSRALPSPPFQPTKIQPPQHRSRRSADLLAYGVPWVRIVALRPAPSSRLPQQPSRHLAFAYIVDLHFSPRHHRSHMRCRASGCSSRSTRSSSSNSAWSGGYQSGGHGGNPGRRPSRASRSSVRIADAFLRLAGPSLPLWTKSRTRASREERQRVGGGLRFRFPHRAERPRSG
jgi:hypothetical protein